MKRNITIQLTIRKKLRNACLAMVCFTLSVFCAGASIAAICTDPSLGIEQLGTVIGSYPPKITSDDHKKEIQEKYNCVKSTLDEILAKNAADARALFLRGKLQAMGHNMDLSGAFEGADKDLQEALTHDSEYKDALLELGRLYVNSNLALAPKAESLFKKAQEIQGKDLLEAAQSGLFFSYYYQGKMLLALNQAKLLKEQWPSEQYTKLYDMTLKVVSK